MNLKDCYIKFGGDFDEVLGRLRREQTVLKFLYKFPDDKSFQNMMPQLSKDYYEIIDVIEDFKSFREE